MKIISLISILLLAGCATRDDGGGFVSIMACDAAYKNGANVVYQEVCGIAQITINYQAIQDIRGF